ncbi:hypothetical protein KIN20_000320 [Parelaphostrongylus tenuis]|uniref:Uncharacterized protein n=1 Tax=Parelaphostrongylus tenuis TaxID=148309 RepID=A0AAD5MD39_PARTN|nr:hypothetical protein KIN20_000320 [Parelaphostrongylus tenuis]
MNPSNLSTVVAPSLVWQPPDTVDHTLAIAIFGVDRAKDWEEFSSKYALEEPLKEEDIGNVSDDEDIVDEDNLEDNEQLFVPQPPTADLKSKRRGRSDERPTSYQNSPHDQKRHFEKSDRREKRRSYTTSILISSRAERPMPITRQK